MDLQGARSVGIDTELQGELAQMRKILLGDPALIYFTDLERFTAALFLFGQLKEGMSGR